MKVCPKCHARFDNEQTYCLNDGSMLVNKPFDASEETIVFPAFNANRGDSQTGSKNSSQTGKIVYSLIGIIVVLTIAFAGFFLWKQNEGKAVQTSANAAPSVNGDYEIKKKELELKERELEIKKQELAAGQKTDAAISSPAVQQPPAEKPLPPVQSPDAGGTKYSGNIGSSNAVFNLSWNKNKTVSGSYYFTNNPSQRYRLSGTNYVDGEIELQEYGNMNARIKMFKSINGNTLCWNGSYFSSNGDSAINFCRYR